MDNMTDAHRYPTGAKDSKTKAHRVPMPEWVIKDVQWPPRYKMLFDAVNPEKGITAENAEIPSWKLKWRLGIYSPTPQYAPGFFLKEKPFYMKSTYRKIKYRRYYEKQMQRIMEKEGQYLRYLPNPADRLTLAGTPLMGVGGAFLGEKEMWQHLAKMKFDDLMKAVDDQKVIRLGLNSKSIIQTWTTGWQNAAIRMFPDLLKRCDVVVEVRDARIPWASAHPDIPQWSRPKPRVIVLTKADLVPPGALEDTIRCLNASDEDRGVPVIAVNAQQGGKMIEKLRTELLKAGAFVNRRRLRKGVNPRAIRVMMAGFPNVGKSSIINSIAGRKVAKGGNATGMTVTPTWHMIGGFRNTELAFLDMPGILPKQFNVRYKEEEVAMMCMCKILSDKVIDFEKTGHDLLFHLARITKESPHCVERGMWKEMSRLYDVDMEKAVRHEGPYASTRWRYDNLAPYCAKLIADFNKGLWGKVQLEPPPVSQEQADIFGDAVRREAQRIAGRKVDDTKLARRPAGLLPAGRRVVTMPARHDPDRPGKIPALVSKKGYGDEGLFDGW